MPKEPNALQKLEIELKVAYLKHLRDVILDVFERPHISDTINKAIMGDLVFEKERPYKMTALINKIDEISLSYKTQKKMLVEIEDLLDEPKEGNAKLIQRLEDIQSELLKNYMKCTTCHEKLHELSDIIDELKKEVKDD